jgi:hypothetical protein
MDIPGPKVVFSVGVRFVSDKNRHKDDLDEAESRSSVSPPQDMQEELDLKKHESRII